MSQRFVCSWGGTPIEPYIPIEAFKGHPTLERLGELGKAGDIAASNPSVNMDCSIAGVDVPRIFLFAPKLPKLGQLNVFLGQRMRTRAGVDNVFDPLCLLVLPVASLALVVCVW